MRRSDSKIPGLICCLGIWLVLLLANGCSSFNRDWRAAATWPMVPGDIQGRWEGTWKSDDSGHNDRLRCLISREPAGDYLARFRANYRTFVNFGYTMRMKVVTNGEVFQFSGDANLGWAAGGWYHYEGKVQGTNFFSTYRCKYDHGTFRMERPAVSPPATTATSSQWDLPTTTRQLVVVTTSGWDSRFGRLRLLERREGQGRWIPLGGSVPVVVGRQGLGWGRGLNPLITAPGPVKKEGDGKSPAGVFRLSSAFGREPAATVRNLKLPYQPLSDKIECVDDVKSSHYNSIVDRGSLSVVDWDSSEKMREIGARYRLGVVVDHNVNPRLAAGGSCIFMHIWQDSHTATTGCTAMEDAQMEALLAWLDPASEPLLVQLPETEYSRLRTDWSLPAL